MSLRTPLVRSVKRLLMGLFTASKTHDCAVILRYHSVKKDPSYHTSTVGTAIIHSEADFAAQMKLIKASYNPVTLDNIADFLNNQSALPSRAIAVTFDDGFADNYEIAAPILDKNGIKATFYITTDHIGNTTIPWFARLRHAFATATDSHWRDNAVKQPFNLEDEGERHTAFLEACRQCAKSVGASQEAFLTKIEQHLGSAEMGNEAPLMMDWDQVRDLIARGHTVGPHTCSHPNLAHITQSEAHKEIATSLERLKEKTSIDKIHFSYPSPILQPHYNDSTVKISRTLGCLTAVTCNPGAVRRGDEPLLLKRIWVPDNLTDFRWEIEKAFRTTPVA